MSPHDDPPEPLEARLGPMGAMVDDPPSYAVAFPRLTRAAADQAPARLVIVPPGPRYNQVLGSCMANGSAKMLGVAAGIPIQLSVDAGYYYARLQSGLPINQDTGAFPEHTAESLKRYGAISVSTWRDSTSASDAHWKTQPDARAQAQGRDHRLEAWYRTLTVSTMKSALLLGHLPGIACLLRASFDGIGIDGRWRQPSGNELNGHWMAVVGYDDTLAPGGGITTPGSFIVLQSWGAWGEAIPEAPGYGRSFWRFPYQVVADRGFLYDSIVYSALDRIPGG